MSILNASMFKPHFASVSVTRDSPWKVRRSDDQLLIPARPRLRFVLPRFRACLSNVKVKLSMCASKASCNRFFVLLGYYYYYYYYCVSSSKTSAVIVKSAPFSPIVRFRCFRVLFSKLATNAVIVKSGPVAANRLLEDVRRRCWEQRQHCPPPVGLFRFLFLEWFVFVVLLDEKRRRTRCFVVVSIPSSSTFPSSLF